MQEMISCEEALRFVQEYLDGELEDAVEAQVRAHFEKCQRCYPQLQLERVYRDALRRANGSVQAPTGLRDAVAKLISEADADE